MRRRKDRPVAAGRLGGEERLVGNCDDFVERVGVDRRGKPETDRERGDASGAEGEREPFAQTFQDLGGRLDVALGKDDDKLFTPDSGR